MTRNINYLVLLLLFVTVWSCRNDEDDYILQSEQKVHEEVILEPQVFISATEIDVAARDSATISAFLKLASFQLPGNADFSSYVVSGVKVYEVRYYSTDENNNQIELSGLVSVPDNENIESIMISFQNGTIVTHSSAPTKNINDSELMLLHAIAGLGYVVLIPDYIGFGASEDLFHPYHYKPLFQTSIRDMILAVKEMTDFNLYPFQLSGDLFLTGYSLGGWATLVSHNYIESNPVDGLNLIGSACGAGAYNLVDMQEYLIDQTYFVQPFYVPYLIRAYRSVGVIQEDLTLFFNEPYASRIGNDEPDLFDGETTKGDINAQLTNNMQDLLSDHLLNNYETHDDFQLLRNALENNSQGPWPNGAPLILYHGDADENVPYFISENLYNNFIELDAPIGQVSFVTLEGSDHSSGVAAMYVDVLDKLLSGEFFATYVE